jgi:hypothetical protein
MDGVESAAWRKSTYSGNNGGNCVEVASWRKSSRSGNSGKCVEAGIAGASLIVVRDTANRDGQTLAFPPGAWASFTASLK